LTGTCAASSGLAPAKATSHRCSTPDPGFRIQCYRLARGPGKRACGEASEVGGGGRRAGRNMPRVVSLQHLLKRRAAARVPGDRKRDEFVGKLPCKCSGGTEERGDTVPVREHRS